ncbi:hypothetical protein ACIRJR_14920 [Streptomyces sp. NPDC102402]|uniref:hypothetical protein n=1 Tax=Streptomyces sp. NPDC102402 TaxID=3366169 RepID=UPI0038182966
MTDRNEHTTDPISAEEPRRTGTAATPSAAPGTASGRTSRTSGTTAGVAPGDSTAVTSGDGRGLTPKSTGHDDPAVPPAPRTAPAVPDPERTGHDGTTGTSRHGTTGTSHHGTTGAEGPLVSHDDQDKLAQRMQQAVTDFVESPRRAVEEADSTFDQIVSGLTEALTERRRVLRASWQEQDTDAQTEELRIALQRYRDISEQLLKI